LFRRLLHNMTNSVGDRGLEHHTLSLEASEIHAHELARLEHRSCTIILPPREVKCKMFATDWLPLSVVWRGRIAHQSAIFGSRRFCSVGAFPSHPIEPRTRPGCCMRFLGSIFKTATMTCNFPSPPSTQLGREVWPSHESMTPKRFEPEAIPREISSRSVSVSARSDRCRSAGTNSP